MNKYKFQRILILLITALTAAALSPGCLAFETTSNHLTDLPAPSADSDSRFSTAQKISSRPTIPVFYPWPADCSGDLWFDCDQPESPYNLIWTSAGIVPEIDSLATDVDPEQTQLMESDPDTLYLINEEWHYWNLNWRTLSPDSKFYLNEYFENHLGSEYGATMMINFQHPDWAGFLAEKAARFQSQGFDGLMLDWWHDDAGNGRSKQETRQARLAIAAAIRERTGDDFILMGNVGWNTQDPTAPYLSGVFLELWRSKPDTGYVLGYQDEEQEPWLPSLERMEDLLLYWDANLAEPRIIAFEPWKITREDFQMDRTNPENSRYARLFTAMAVVIPERGYILYADHNDDWEGGDHQHAYYDFYRTDFGKATSGRIAIQSGAAYKEFQTGLIAYNRTEENILFSHPLLGEIQLQPLSGLFLKFEE